MAHPKLGQGANNGLQVEWHHCEDEVEWQNTQVSPLQTVTREPSLPAHHWSQRLKRQFGWLVLFVLIALVTGSVALWKQGEMGLAKIEEEIDSAIAAEAWSSPQQVAQEAQLRDTFAAPNERLAESELLQLEDNWAVVQVVVHAKGEDGVDGSAYRQRRVYEEVAGGWRRIQPTALHWGKPHELQSRYFRFHYFEQDESVVEGAAEQLDRLYSAFYTALLSGSPSDDVLVVHVKPTQQERQLNHYFFDRKAIYVPSPATALAPLEISEHEILQQSMALAFSEYLAHQAAAEYQLPAEWIPLRDGLRLWLIWEQELSLSRWREALVQLSFSDSKSFSLTVESTLLAGPESVENPFSTPPQDLGRTDVAFALCDHHYLWMYSPTDIGMPITCFHSRVLGKQALTWPNPYGPHEPVPLPQLLTLRFTDNGNPPPVVYLPSITNTIAMATTFEFISATFGREQIPRLLAAVSEHKSWDSLIPALFHMSQSEFEEEWRVFLKVRYGSGR